MIEPAGVNENVPPSLVGPTEVITLPAFAKLSALAPLVPVMTLNVSAVSSKVVSESSTTSATGVMVMGTISVSVVVPSVAVKVSEAEPLKSAVDCTKVMPVMAATTSAAVPENFMAAEPSAPEIKVSPVVPDRLRMPWVTPSVTVTVPS